MHVLFISRSKTGIPHAFVKEQADFLMKNYGISIQHFLIQQGGVSGYLKAIAQLTELVKKNKVDLIHVHYGLWSLVAVISRWLSRSRFKIITTFHGSDINKDSERKIALLALPFISHSILVSPKMSKHFKERFSIIPCGVDTDVELGQREITRTTIGWAEEDFVILFSSNFDRKVKDPEFAFKVVEAFTKAASRPVRFIELKGYTRSQLTGIMQAADALILCSHSEGSPQIIKEAIINSLPIISNNVGDIEEICAEVDHCFIVEKEVDKYVACLQLLAGTETRISNRAPVLEKFDNNKVAAKVFEIYKQVLKHRQVLN